MTTKQSPLDPTWEGWKENPNAPEKPIFFCTSYIQKIPALIPPKALTEKWAEVYLTKESFKNHFSQDDTEFWSSFKNSSTAYLSSPNLFPNEIKMIVPDDPNNIWTLPQQTPQLLHHLLTQNWKEDKPSLCTLQNSKLLQTPPLALMK